MRTNTTANQISTLTDVEEEENTVSDDGLFDQMLSLQMMEEDYDLLSPQELQELQTVPSDDKWVDLPISTINTKFTIDEVQNEVLVIILSLLLMIF